MAIATAQAECALMVASVGSFRRAASELYMSQPAMSAQIASLERSLGVRLFERTSSGARPTKDGEAVLPHLREFLASQEVLLREAARLAMGKPEPLRIGSHRLGLTTILPPALRVLRAAFGPLEVSVTLQRPADAVNALLSGTIEIALSVRSDHRSLDEERVVEVVGSTTPVVVCFAPGHRFERRDVITSEDLNNETLIVGPRGFLEHEFARWYTRGCVGVVWYEVPDVLSALAMVRDGVGSYINGEALCAGFPGVLYRPLDYPHAAALTMLRRADRELSPAGRMVWEMLAPPFSAAPQRGPATA